MLEACEGKIVKASAMTIASVSRTIIDSMIEVVVLCEMC
jgi:hypothetical protein